jgi:hypothetical protein
MRVKAIAIHGGGDEEIQVLFEERRGLAIASEKAFNDWIPLDAEMPVGWPQGDELKNWQETVVNGLRVKEHFVVELCPFGDEGAVSITWWYGDLYSDYALGCYEVDWEYDGWTSPRIFSHNMGKSHVPSIAEEYDDPYDGH